MIVVICGIIAGILMSYCITRIMEGKSGGYYEAASVSHPLKNSLIIVLWATIVLVEIIVLCALIGAILTSYEVSTGTIALSRWITFGREIVETVLIPFIAGSAIGVLLLILYKAGIFEKNSTLAVATLIIGVIIVSFAATEQQYGWFSRLMKVSVASNELDFAPIRQNSASPLPSTPSSDPIAVLGPAAVDKAMYFIKQIAGDIAADREFVLGLADDQKLDIANESLPDFRFMSEIAIPLVKSLQLIHNERADSNVSDFFSRDTISAVRSLANLHYTVKVEADFLTNFKTLQNGILTAWTHICEDETWIEDAESLNESDPSCKNGKPTNQEQINKYFREYVYLGEHFESTPLSSRPLSRDRPYGQILSAWFLMADGEPEAALHDLVNWNKTFAEEHNEAGRRIVNSVYKFRILANIVRLYVAKGIARDNELESLISLFSAKSLSDELISKYKNKLLEIKKLSGSSESGIDPQCANLSEDWFKRLYMQRLLVLNDFIDVIGKYPEVIRVLDADRTVGQYAGELVSINIGCLLTTQGLPPEKYGNYYVIPENVRKDVIPPPNTSDAWEAFYDSRAVAYRGLASALGLSDPTSWANAMCKSLNSAKIGHELGPVFS
jgi:hypothetical protein